MRRFVLRYNPGCIALTATPKANSVQFDGNPNMESESDVTPEDIVERTSLRSKLAKGITLGGCLIWAVSAAWAQNAPTEQCSLAVVSHWVGTDARVCDSRVDRQMAQRGHAFEQIQLGIASILAI